MKKIISQISLIVLIMAIGMISVCMEQVYAASIVEVLSYTASVGETVTVTIRLPDGTCGYDGHVSFDPTKLKYISNSVNGALSGNDKIKVADFTNNDSQVSNLTITFTVIAEGESSVISNFKCTDALGKIIYSGVNLGTIKNPVVEPPKETTPPAQTPDTNQPDNTPKPSDTKEPTDTKNEPKFTDVQETVYTTVSCNVRESYSTDSKKVTKFEKGKELKRTGVGDNGWSKIEYDGKTAYIYSEYLTTEKPADPKFKDVDEVMYAIQDCNVRKSWTTDSDKAGYLKKAKEVKRTGIGDNGWSRIEYDGEVAYVATRLLSDEEPVEEENIVDNTVLDNNVVDTNEIDNNSVAVSNDALGILQNQIGVIPEVGNNYSEYAYIVVTLISLIGVLYISYKSRNTEK